MGPKPIVAQTRELFRQRLDEQIDMRHPLVRLNGFIDWAQIEAEFAAHLVSVVGCPASSPRLIAGLLCRQHTFSVSDEVVVDTWVENPYWKHFCGETYLQTEVPLDGSSLTSWGRLIGEAGVETLLRATIEAARRAMVVGNASVERVIIDSNVMPRALAHPTGSRLLEKSRVHLVKLAAAHGLKLRQNSNRVAARLAAHVGRCAHAKQLKRISGALRTLRPRVGRVRRDVKRQLGQLAPVAQAKARELLLRTGRILEQRTKGKAKLYALHALEVDYIAKGTARTPYEFGVKVSIATTLKDGLVMGMRSMPGNPYDGHALARRSSRSRS